MKWENGEVKSIRKSQEIEEAGKECCCILCREYEILISLALSYL